MPQKIFISYRRQDAAANALGIGQYLENAFGRKNVFIDVDMRAGAKFPTVLEQRLAECKVMIVLIGPDWLTSRDEQGGRRLDSSDDWVRLEIAHALKRDITVIPVLVNGAALPERTALPDDIRGLLDHQAVSVTNAGFRHEMSGLVHDLRSIPSPRPWRRYAAIAAGVVLLLALGIFGATKYSNILEHIRPTQVSQTPDVTKQNDLWRASPGEWVLYAVDNIPVGYYFKPSAVKAFGDRVVYTSRFILKSFASNASPENTSPVAAYQEDVIALDCQKSVFATAETTIYNKSGDVVSHYQRADPLLLDMSTGQPANKPGSIISLAEKIVCSDQIRTALAQAVNKSKLTYLAVSSTGDGDLFYGPIKKLVDPVFQSEALIVLKFYSDHKLEELLPEKTALGHSASYRTLAEPLQLDCKGRKVQAPKTEYYDQGNNLVYLFVPAAPQLLDPKENSPFAGLLNLVCGVPAINVTGTYEGTIDMTYKTGGHGEQKISITIEQVGQDLKLSYQLPTGHGKGSGTLADSGSSVSLQSTAPECPGSYEGTIKFAEDTVTLSYKGEDCGGPVEGHGTAKRTKV